MPTKSIINAYYETLYELLQAGRKPVEAIIDELLPPEISRLGQSALPAERRQAYREACLVFLEERLEMYNPVGVQYTFAATSREEAFELEAALDWYDSREEFAELCRQAETLQRENPDQTEMEVARLLVLRQGAWPDRSIIRQYRRAPRLNHLPDYILAQAIEQFLDGK